jgi:hypothetical protein
MDGTRFGTFDKLPFDLHLHRKPILYNLPDTSDKERVKSEKEALTRRLTEAMGLMVQDIEATEGRHLASLRAKELEFRRRQVQQSRAEFETARHDIIADFVTIPSGFDLTDPAETIRQIGKALKPALDTIWRAAGLIGDPFVDEDGKFG